MKKKNKCGIKLWILILSVFIVMAVLGAGEYPAIETLVRILCPSCIGLSG